jgi:hypothetical protein
MGIIGPEMEREASEARKTAAMSHTPGSAFCPDPRGGGTFASTTGPSFDGLPFRVAQPFRHGQTGIHRPTCRRMDTTRIQEPAATSSPASTAPIPRVMCADATPRAPACSTPHPKASVNAA